MILTDQQSKQLTNNNPYDCSLIKRQWSFSIFNQDTSPLGNIIVFESEFQTEIFRLDKALIVAGELPNTNSFGGIAFLRLYCAQVGTILSEIIKKNCYVEESCIFVEQQQASISLTNDVKNFVLFNMIFSMSETNDLYTLNLEEQDNQTFKKHVVDSFHFLTKSIFLESQRDNF